MLTEEDDVELHALAARGWSVSAIATHTGRDRKTIRKYLKGEGARGRRRPAPNCLQPFLKYIAARYDPHLRATVLHGELVEAGFERSYPTLVRKLRRLELRPVCLVCQQRGGRAPTVELEHPAGEEIQWDWLELPVTPWGQPAFLLVSALSHSGRFRAVFCEQMTFGHLAEAMHQVLVGLGGTPRVWRTDRMATIVIPGSDRLTVDAAELAKHYGVEVAVCPPRRAQRKGVVDAAIKYITNSWWRSARITTMAEAQASLDRWTVAVADRRPRSGGTAAYPATIRVERKASRSALVVFEGNRYSVPPAHAGRTLTVICRVGEPTLRIVSAAGEILAEHRRAPAGGGQTIRTRPPRTPAPSKRPFSPRLRPITAAGARPTGRPASPRWPNWRGSEASPAGVYASIAVVRAEGPDLVVFPRRRGLDSNQGEHDSGRVLHGAARRCTRDQKIQSPCGMRPNVWRDPDSNRGHTIFSPGAKPL
jgi:transposase